jgi:hypothetical protein
MILRTENQRQPEASPTTSIQPQGQMLALGTSCIVEVMRSFYPNSQMLKDFDIALNMQTVSELEKMKSKFDFIYDHDLLTRTPFELDRRRLLNAIHGALQDHGIFALKTAVLTKNYDVNESFESVELDENQILWGQTPATDEVPGVVARNGRYYVARKKIATVEAIRAELQKAGFRIIQEEIEVPVCGGPDVLKMILVRDQTRTSTRASLFRKFNEL